MYRVIRVIQANGKTTYWLTIGQAIAFLKKLEEHIVTVKIEAGIININIEDNGQVSIKFTPELMQER